MSYHAFKDEEGESFGSFETFYIAGTPGAATAPYSPELTEQGFYWWACFPGCIPDGEPCGPFETESAAIADAQGQG